MLLWLLPTGLALDADATSDTDNPTALNKSEVIEVTTSAQFQQHCTPQSSICIIALLDGRSSNHQQHLSVVKAVAEKHAHQPLAFVHVNASQQRTLREHFSVSTEQLPAMIALSAGRLRYAAMQPPFGELSANNLIRGVLSGSALTTSLQVRICWLVVKAKL